MLTTVLNHLVESAGWVFNSHFLDMDVENRKRKGVLVNAYVSVRSTITQVLQGFYVSQGVLRM